MSSSGSEGEPPRRSTPAPATMTMSGPAGGGMYDGVKTAFPPKSPDSAVADALVAERMAQRTLRATGGGGSRPPLASDEASHRLVPPVGDARAREFAEHGAPTLNPSRDPHDRAGRDNDPPGALAAKMLQDMEDRRVRASVRHPDEAGGPAGSVSMGSGGVGACSSRACKQRIVDLERLLAFYKARSEEFDAERDDLINKFKACAVVREAHHALEWELGQRTKEVGELQRALSQAHEALFAERQRVIDLEADNKTLLLQEREDKIRLAGSSGSSADSPSESALSASGAPEGASREDIVNLLVEKCESFQKQVAELTKFSSERLASLTEDGRIREEEQKVQLENGARRVEALLKEKQKLQGDIERVTKDYLVLRHNSQATESKMNEALSDALRERTRALEEIESTRSEAERQVADSRRVLEEQAEAYADQFRRQVIDREDELMHLERLYKEKTGQVPLDEKSRVNMAEATAGRAERRYRDLQKRRRQDIEGFGSSLAELRRMFIKIGRNQQRLSLRLRLNEGKGDFAFDEDDLGYAFNRIKVAERKELGEPTGPKRNPLGTRNGAFGLNPGPGAARKPGQAPRPSSAGVFRTTGAGPRLPMTVQVGGARQRKKKLGVSRPYSEKMEEPVVRPDGTMDLPPTQDVDEDIVYIPAGGDMDKDMQELNEKLQRMERQLIGLQEEEGVVPPRTMHAAEGSVTHKPAFRN